MKRNLKYLVCIAFIFLTIVACEKDPSILEVENTQTLSNQSRNNNPNGNRGGNNGNNNGGNNGPGGNNGGGNNGPGGNNGGNNGNNNPHRLDALPFTVVDPIDNQSTAAKIELGRNLFWDPILSGTKDVSCATCHHPSRGYGDGIDLSIGVGGRGFSQDRIPGPNGFVRRNAPTIINTAFNGIDENGNINPDAAEMFWDKRTRSLETQALLPIHSFVEMRGGAYSEALTMDSVVARIQAISAYRQSFSNIFGNNSINQENIAKAISAFERSIIANNSRFDRFMNGETNSLNQQEIRGMELFQTVGCVNCHNGPMLSDFDLHVLGVRDNPKNEESDEGDGNYAFRTASLRNLSLTGPYMHNGEFNTLREVLRFYNNNRNQPRNPNVSRNQLDPNFRGLLNVNRNEQDDIIAFLNSLNDDDFDKRIPNRVPSGLAVGGNISGN